MKNCWNSVVASVVLPELCNIHFPFEKLKRIDNVETPFFFFCVNSALFLENLVVLVQALRMEITKKIYLQFGVYA